MGRVPKERKKGESQAHSEVALQIRFDSAAATKKWTARFDECCNAASATASSPGIGKRPPVAL